MTSDIYTCLDKNDSVTVKYDALSDLWALVFDWDNPGYTQIRLYPQQLISLHEQLTKIRQEHRI